MPGFMDAMQQGAQAPAQAPAPAAPMPQEGQMQSPAGGPQQASPEDQEAYEIFVSTAMNMMYDKKMLPKLKQMLEGAGDPIEGLAEAAVMITHRVSESAEQNGQPLNNDIVFNAGTEIFNQLADVSTRAGIHDFEQDRDGLETAYFRGLDKFRGLMEQSGRLDQEASQRDLQQLQGMSESGELEQMLRGLAENDPRAARPAEAQAAPPQDMM
jgi:hypothetical protein